MPIQKRSVFSVILLSIITCGIYIIYWFYVTAKELQMATGRNQFSPALIVLLAIFITPAATVLIALEANERLNDIRTAKGMPTVDNAVVWILLGLLIFPVQMGLIQHEINQVA